MSEITLDMRRLVEIVTTAIEAGRDKEMDEVSAPALADTIVREETFGHGA